MEIEILIDEADKQSNNIICALVSNLIKNTLDLYNGKSNKIYFKKQIDDYYKRICEELY